MGGTREAVAKGAMGRTKAAAAKLGGDKMGTKVEVPKLRGGHSGGGGQAWWAFSGYGKVEVWCFTSSTPVSWHQSYGW